MRNQQRPTSPVGQSNTRRATCRFTVHRAPPAARQTSGFAKACPQRIALKSPSAPQRGANCRHDSRRVPSGLSSRTPQRPMQATVTSEPEVSDRYLQQNIEIGFGAHYDGGYWPVTNWRRKVGRIERGQLTATGEQQDEPLQPRSRFRTFSSIFRTRLRLRRSASAILSIPTNLGRAYHVPFRWLTGTRSRVCPPGFPGATSSSVKTAMRTSRSLLRLPS